MLVIARRRAESRRPRRGGGGRTRAHRDPAVPRRQRGSGRPAGPAGPAAGRGPRACATGPDGASSVPSHRGHHTRCRSRTFHRVPHWEHTWIIGPAYHDAHAYSFQTVPDVSVVGDDRSAGLGPGQHAAGDVDRLVAVASQILSDPLGPAAGVADHEQSSFGVDLGHPRRHVAHRDVLRAGCVAALPFVVLANVEQDHGVVEVRGYLGHRGLRDRCVIHDFMLTRPIRRRTAGDPAAIPDAIHSFHRFIHRMDQSGFPCEPLNRHLGGASLWITMARNARAINRARAVRAKSLVGLSTGGRCPVICARFLSGEQERL